MQFSIQSRVLALVGLGVFLAVGTLSLLSRSTLLSLEDEVRHDHERLAATIAREVSRAVGQDLRLLAGVAGNPPAAMPQALRDLRRFGRLTTAAFVVDTSGSILACEPAFECAALRTDVLLEAAARSVASQRPFVGDAVTHLDGRRRIGCALPVRAVKGQTIDALGLILDPADRRLAELLQASEIAASLSVTLRDGTGGEIGRPHSDVRAGDQTASATVEGTAWTLQLTDTGPDPTAPIVAFRSRSLWLAPMLAAVAMLFGWGIARSIRRPLVDLTAAAERIAHGSLEPPINTLHARQGGDEIARLARALERMRADLLASMNAIEGANEELERRIVERTSELGAMNARLEDRERVRQQLLRQVISAQEDERKRVARELHDQTSQSLAALAMGVDLALVKCGNEDMTARLVAIRTLVDRMHVELQRMIVDLRPSVLDDLGLEAAIRWFADRHLTPSGVAVRLEFSGLDERLAPNVETAIFRAVQEALVNVERHAAAESVLIQASRTGDRLEIEVEDDGCGFDTTSVVPSPQSLRGVGLMGMRERVEILGGHVTVDSSPGGGTRVAFSIPLSVAAMSEGVHA